METYGQKQDRGSHPRMGGDNAHLTFFREIRAAPRSPLTPRIPSRLPPESSKTSGPLPPGVQAELLKMAFIVPFSIVEMGFGKWGNGKWILHDFGGLGAFGLRGWKRKGLVGFCRVKG